MLSSHRKPQAPGGAPRLMLAAVYLLAFVLACAALPACADVSAGLKIVATHNAIIHAPPRHVPTTKIPDGPLLGNGDVGVVLAGPPQLQQFYIGKNDFWTNTPASAKVITVGRVEIAIPALKGASYRQVQDMALAEVRGTFSKGALTVHTRSWVDANANYLITELRSDGLPVSVSVRLWGGEQAEVPSRVADDGTPANIGRETYGGGRWYFDGDIAGVRITKAVLSGKVAGEPRKPGRFDGKSNWRELPVGKMDKSVSVAAWIKIQSASSGANYIVSKGPWNSAYSLGLSDGRLRWAINGVFVQTGRPLPLHKWLYVVGTFNGRKMCTYVNGKLEASLGGNGTDFFLRKADETPGAREVAVATRVLAAKGGVGGMRFELTPGKPVFVATAILSDLDAKDCLAAARASTAALTPSKIAALSAAHRAWWARFWSRSFIQIPDKFIEAHWYAALYVMGSCSRRGKTAPGLWGDWVTTDYPAWQGDYHLNYNFEAQFYIVYSSNHADLSLPYYQALVDWMPQAREFAKKRGWHGLCYPVSIGPWGLCSYWPHLDWGQRSDGAYAAMDFIWYWQYTRDAAWLKRTGYPFLRGIVSFWDHYLTFKDGRYWDVNDAIQENCHPSDVNPILTLGLLRTLYSNIIPMSERLGVDAGKRAKWRDILAKLSPFPTQKWRGKTIFRYTEKGTRWFSSNTLGIQQIFPAGAIGLDSSPKLLAISRNTIDAMSRWTDENGFSSWYTACARVGYDPKVILAHLHQQCVSHSMPNLLLRYSGGGIENVSGFLAINEMMLQSYDGVIRIFPDWPRDENARFGSLRAVGAFLVSAQMKHGVIGGVKIVSQKGCTCTIVNPWPGKTVRIIRSGELAKNVNGGRFTLKTAVGEIITLQPKSRKAEDT